MPRLGSLLLLMYTGLLASCTKDATPEANPGANVVWVLCDGLRYDQSSGMESLRSFSKSATVYDAATACASDCVSSLGSLWTGLLPFEHGAHRSRTVRNGKKVYNQHSLTGSQRTIAEAFDDAGYETVLVTSNLQFGDLSLGFDQGFDELILAAGSAEQVNDRVRNWLATRANGPFFLFVHYSDTRLAYAPAPGEPAVEPGSARDTLHLAKELAPEVLGGTSYSGKALQQLQARYSDGVASVDHGLGELIQTLEEKKLLNEAVVVVTADHGQSLGEHNLLADGRGLYEELVHVPLAIKDPRQALPKRETQRFSTVNLPALVLKLAFTGLPEPDVSYFDSHLDEVAVEQWYADPKDFGQAWSDRFDQVLRATYYKRFKLIDSDEGTDQLYDLGADPKERTNLIQRHPGIAADMRMRLKHVFGE